MASSTHAPSPSPAPSGRSSTSNADNSMVKNRSALKDFIASIAVIRGDLSNITAPPFVLDEKSAVELPSFWAERPSVFVAPAREPLPDFLSSSNAPAEAKRALLVLRWFLSSLRGQQYGGRDPRSGVKKPLNAFLGELFLARWEDDSSQGIGRTEIVSEQVSHHPPVTACRVWNEKHGIYAEGFTRQEITLSGVSVNIAQIGHATLSLANFDNETYLIPLPSIKVKGILSGSPYPELGGTYYIPSTNGYMASIDFSGKGFLGLGGDDKKHGVDAKIYKESSSGSGPEADSDPLFTISGNWNTTFTIRDETTGQELEVYDTTTAADSQIQTDNLEQQDPWESHRAWAGVRDALRQGDMQGTSDAKNVVEEGQRAMRKDEEREGTKWETIFFRPTQEDNVAATLAKKLGKTIDPQETVALWRFDESRWKNSKKPFHGGLRPDNSKSDVNGAQQSRQLRQPVPDQVQRGRSVDGAVATATVPAATVAAASSGQNGDVQPDQRENADRNDSVHPVMSPKQQQQEIEQERDLNSGIEGMTVQEKLGIEEMLRNQYSSAK